MAHYTFLHRSVVENLAFTHHQRGLQYSVSQNMYVYMYMYVCDVGHYTVVSTFAKLTEPQLESSY